MKILNQTISKPFWNSRSQLFFGSRELLEKVDLAIEFYVDGIAKRIIELRGFTGFTEEAIHLIQRIERARAIHLVDMAWIKTMGDLLEEAERLLAEKCFQRNA